MRLDRDPVFARRKCDPRPPENPLPRRVLPGPERPAVHLQGHLGGVRVDLDLRHGIRAFREPAAGHVEHRLGAPVRLVEVECILLHLSVIGDQPLVVAARLVALVASVGGEVVEAPDELAPDIGSCLERGPVGLVVEVLVLLGVVGPVWLGPIGALLVLDNAASGAELTHPERVLRVLGVGLIQGGRELGELAPVPAEVPVEGHDLGDPVLGVVALVVGRVGRQARGILDPRHHVELLDRVERRRAARLVAHAPEADRGMVVVLQDHLLELLLGAVQELGGT